MKTPGFTAEVSLYKTSENHRTTQNSSTKTNGGEVLPQFAHWTYCDPSGCYSCTQWGCIRIGHRDLPM